MTLSNGIFCLCDYSNLYADGKLCINGIFDNFSFKELPAFWPQMYIVAQVAGLADTKYSVTIKIIEPDGKPEGVKSLDTEIVMGRNGKANIVTAVKGFELKKYGLHKVQLESNKKLIAELEFMVNPVNEVRKVN